MNDIQLLMVHADDRRPFVEDGLRAGESSEAVTQPGHLYVDGEDQNPLDRQGWGIIAPVGPEGDRLLALVDGLIRHRAAQTELLKIYRVPPVMSDRDLRAFRDDTYLAKGSDEAPLYLLILGDLHQVPIELQATLANHALLGRIAFSSDEGYAAYAQKVVAAEQSKPAAAPRALYLNVRDGTAATTIGYRALMTPTLQHARAIHERGKLPASAIVEIESPDDIGAALFAEAGKPDPAVLFSISHGLGRPRRGWKSLEEQRAMQGAMSFGMGRSLTASDVATSTFLPNGVWFFLACYGAATPSKSAYYAWLKQLKEAGGFDANVDSVLAGLPKDGEPPFIAALPKAALANPKGPLAIMGHADLAWTYSFQDVGKDAKSRATRFQNISTRLVDGNRVGIAAATLLKTFFDASVDVSSAADADAAGSASTDAEARADRANLWMLRNDVAGYMLLGDPAAQLPIAARKGQRAPEASVQAFLGSLGGAAASTPVAPGGATKKLDVETMEAAVLAVLSEDLTAKKAAEKYGVERSDVQAWADAYQAAGRAALGKL